MPRRPRRQTAEQIPPRQRAGRLGLRRDETGMYYYYQPVYATSTLRYLPQSLGPGCDISSRSRAIAEPVPPPPPMAWAT